jgi:hypothetical protein
MLICQSPSGVDSSERLKICRLQGLQAGPQSTVRSRNNTAEVVAGQFKRVTVVVFRRMLPPTHQNRTKDMISLQATRHCGALRVRL